MWVINLEKIQNSQENRMLKSYVIWVKKIWRIRVIY